MLYIPFILTSCFLIFAPNFTASGKITLLATMLLHFSPHCCYASRHIVVKLLATLLLHFSPHCCYISRHIVVTLLVTLLLHFSPHCCYTSRHIVVTVLAPSCELHFYRLRSVNCSLKQHPVSSIHTAPSFYILSIHILFHV